MENSGSPREELFAEYPEPLVSVTHFKPELRAGDEYYWDGLEGFIKFLSGYIKTIQNQEGRSMMNFKTTLDSLKTKDQQEKRGEKLDQLVRAQYKDAIGQIKERRRQFRALLKDAVDQKQNFLQSILMQKEEEAVIAKKMAKITGNDESKKTERDKLSVDFFGSFALIIQFVLILIYIVATDFAGIDTVNNNGGPYRADDYFSYLIHIGLMVTFGFGYLLVWIKKYGFSGVALNFFLVAFSCQWGILNDILFSNISSNATSAWDKGNISIRTLITSFYAAATVSVSFGGLSGKLNAAETLILAFLEVFFFHVNRYVVQLRLAVSDPGGSMTIHLFGAYFALAASYWVSKSYDPQHLQVWKRFGSETSYHSNFMSLIATVFLFCLFPSFNAALAPDGTQHRATINTFIGMMGSGVMAFILSHSLRGRRFHIIDIQNATLAGGVAMACGHSINILPGAALVVGSVAGALSVVGFNLIQPWFEKKLPFKVYDTRGVHNLHGLPGLIGGFASVLALGTGGGVFGQPHQEIFANGLPNQGGFQGAGVLISLGLGLAFGFFTGMFIYLLRFGAKRTIHNPYRDEYEFAVPDDYALQSKPNDIPEL